MHRDDLRIGNQIPVMAIGLGHPQLGGLPVGCFLIDIGQGHHLNISQPSHGLDVEGADESCTYYADFYLLHICTPPGILIFSVGSWTPVHSMASAAHFPMKSMISCFCGLFLSRT